MVAVYGVRERKESYLKLKDGTWLFHYQQGSGPPLIILHAFGGSSWSWREVVPELAEHFTCYVVDLPGYDRSSIPDRRYAIEDYTDAIVELMDQEGLKTSHLLGSQTGSMMSLDMGGRYPERLRRMVLLSCPGWTSEEGARVFWNHFVPRQPNGDYLIAPFQGEQGKEAWAYGQSIRARSSRWNAQGHEENTHWDVPSHAVKVQVPTLLLYGEEDFQVRRETRLLELINGSRSVHIPGAGLAVIGQNPVGVAREATAFLKEEA